MTKEELENKLKISENTCIHCPTTELAKQVLDIFHKTGLKWCNGKYYMICNNWDSDKENTVYHPFDGAYSSLEYAQLTGYKIISAEEFITLHTEEFNLENYEPKEELTGFPKEIIARMLDCQQEQGNKRDVSVFEKHKSYTLGAGGFDWDKTKEKDYFWHEVIIKKDFDLFFKKYPKKEENQVFRVEDKVYDIILEKVGIVKEINLRAGTAFLLKVVFENYGTVFYPLEGKFLSKDKYPRLLHYRNNYDYSVIDFNNLPQRQEVKRWRAEVGEKYYYLDIYFEVHSFLEEYSNTDTKLYKIGNYFQTKEQAQEVADKLNEYFKQLINK